MYTGICLQELTVARRKEPANHSGGLSMHVLTKAYDGGTPGLSHQATFGSRRPSSARLNYVNNCWIRLQCW